MHVPTARPQVGIGIDIVYLCPTGFNFEMPRMLVCRRCLGISEGRMAAHTEWHILPRFQFEGRAVLQGGAARFDTGNGKKLSSTQATPVRQAAWLLLSLSPFRCQILRPHSVQGG